MTLWNLIRDFFVQYIFGGVDSTNTFYFDNKIGSLLGVIDGRQDFTENADVAFPILKVGQGTFGDIFEGSIGNVPNTYVYTTLGDWLSTTFTVITLILLVLFLYLFVKWIFKLFSGLLH